MPNKNSYPVFSLEDGLQTALYRHAFVLADMALHRVSDHMMGWRRTGDERHARARRLYLADRAARDMSKLAFLADRPDRELDLTVSTDKLFVDLSGQPETHSAGPPIVAELIQLAVRSADGQVGMLVSGKSQILAVLPRPTSLLVAADFKSSSHLQEKTMLPIIA